MATEAKVGAADRAAGARVGAAVVALFWALFFFGIVDLMVSVLPSESLEFADVMLLETSWGLLYTCMVPMPLIAWSVRPAGWVGPQVVAIAGCVLVAAVAGDAVGQVFVAFLVAASVAFPHMWRPPPRWALPWAATRVWPPPGSSSGWRSLSDPAYWPAGGLVLFGMAAALAHAGGMVDVGAAEDDVTAGMMHAPMQAGFALAVPVAAGVAVVAMAAAETNRVGSWWCAVVPPAVSAVWFGVVSVRYPDVVGSLGEVGGVAAICWGVALPVLTWGTTWLRRRGHTASTPHR